MFVMSCNVKLTTATTDKEAIHFSQIHSDCGCQLKQEMFCPSCNKSITDKATQIKRGYNVDDSFVEITDEELASASPEKTTMIDIFRCVKPSEIKAVFFDKPYHMVLELDKKGNGAYPIFALIYQAMLKRGYWAIGKVVMGKKESLVAIEPHDGIFSLYKMRYADEVKDIEEFSTMRNKVLSTIVEEKQIDMACQMLDNMTGDFSPEQYHDEWSAIMRDIIEKKAKGETFVPVIAQDRPSNVIDLTAMLQASLQMQKAVNQ